MAKNRALNDFVIWGLSIALAATFLLAGVPKLFGWETIGFDAVAMRGFPRWVQAIVGVVEVAGAAALLVPATATFAAVALACVMVPAALTQYARGDGLVWIPAVVLALLLLVAWRRNTRYVSARYRQFADSPHPLLHDGVIAGLIGAAVIAAWF